MSNTKNNDEAIDAIVRDELTPLFTHQAEVMSDGKVRLKVDLKRIAALVLEQRGIIEQLTTRIDELEDGLLDAHERVDELEAAHERSASFSPDSAVPSPAPRIQLADDKPPKKK